jgi:hypothetical protein
VPVQIARWSELDNSPAHAGLDIPEREARLAVLPGRLLLVPLRIAAHRSSRSVIWALRNAKPTLEALIFGGNRRATFLRAFVFGRIIDAAYFFTIPATLAFGRDHSNGTIVLDACFNSFPRAHSLLKTGRKPHGLGFIGICRCVGIRQIAGARSNFYLTVRVSGVPRHASMDSQDRPYARPVG